MGKVKFGLSGCEYGVLNSAEKVAQSKRLPGLTSAKLELTNELKTLSADDGPYVVISGGITEAKLTIETYDLTSEARQDFFGITVENGIEKYTKDLTPNDVAILFRTKMDDGNYVWVGLLKGKFNLPGLEAATVDGAPDPKADSIEGSFVARGGEDGTVLLIGREDAEGFDLETFKGMVFPAAAE
jgi:phi13 family phage major tail protein